MLAEGVLEYLGVSTLVLGILAVFWKGDEAISADFRKSVADLLLQSDIAKYNSDHLSGVLLGMINQLYGRKHFRVRCVVTSFLVSLGLLISIQSVYNPQHLVLLMSQFLGSPGPEIMFPIVGGTIFATVFSNMVSDYISIFKSRILLSRNLHFGIIFLADVVLTYAIFVLIYSTSTGLIFFVYSAGGHPLELHEMVTSLMLGFAFDPINALFSVDRLALPALLTTFITVSWSAVLVFGHYGIRFFILVGPITRFALNIREKPIRSIGVFFTISAVPLAIGIAGFRYLLSL